LVIDANLYWFPEALFSDEVKLKHFLSEVPTARATKGYLKQSDNGVKQIVIEKPAGYPSLNYAQGDYILEQVLADLDKAGADKALLKLPGCQEWMSLESCKLFNDGMADFAKRSNGRLIPLGVVPPVASQEVFDEIDRCRNELGIRNLQMTTHYGTDYLDAEKFAPFFEKVNEQETTIYIHHSPIPVEYECLYEYNNLRRSYGRCTDQTIAICREVFSGFFDKYPNLKLVHSMLGGGFFAIANMMFPQQAKTQEKVQRFETQNSSVRENFEKHIFFEMSHAQPWGKDALECAVKVLGADHIIWGTSYPVRKEWLLDGPAAVRALEISDEDKEAILSGNARRVYALD
jgi:hypothetical protein